MTATTLRATRAHYEADGYHIHGQSLFPPDLLARAIEGMDAVRRGEYDTGRSPQPSLWTPGDDLNKLCKIEQPQFASRAIQELFRYPALGTPAAELTGASRVQVWSYARAPSSERETSFTRTTRPLSSIATG